MPPPKLTKPSAVNALEAWKISVGAPIRSVEFRPDGTMVITAASPLDGIDATPQPAQPKRWARG